MANATSGAVPSDLKALEARFERWRRDRVGRRIPDALWEGAVVAARKHGASRTSRVLRLNANCLRQRMKAVAGAVKAAGSGQTPPAFVEVAFPQASSPPACVLELTNGRGLQLRVEVHAQALESLCSMLHESRGTR